jgi:ATP-binding cassette subfamily B multidrug efflux pump
MLLFAKPYWKLIVLSILLTGLIVSAGLAQPYLIKVAIDQHINGIFTPMVSVSTSEADQAETILEENGLNPEETATFRGQVFYRIQSEPVDNNIKANFPSTLSKAKIITIEGDRYLIEGWNKTLSDDTEYQLSNSNNEITIEGSTYPAVPLSQEEEQLFRQNDYTGMIYLGIIYLVLITGAALINYFQSNSLQFTGQSIIYDIRQSVFKHFARMQISYYDKNPIGRLVTRITHDVESLNQLYSQVIVNLIKEVFMLVGIIFIMFQMSVELTLISFTVIPAIIVITFYFKKVIRKAQRYMRHVLSRLNVYLAENLSGMKTVQLFTREEKQMQQFTELNEEHYRAGMRQTILNSIFNPSIGFFGNISLALLVWYGGRNVLDGAVTFGIVYAFTHYVRQFFEPLRGLADRFNQIQAALASAERIFDTLEEKPTIVNPQNPKSLPVKVRGEIEFDQVWFAYQGEDWVLKDVSFTIKPGETIGIVGATGAGKSSIIQLINRFYDIQKGAIRIDGVNIQDVPLKELRKHIGIIQQDAFIFSGTVYDNIRLNHDGVSDEEVVQAARAVNIDDFFRRLPHQYETQLGEQGTVLSAGQQQLLSFLRAMIANPSVLILDEATANIDTETELVVQHTLKNISKGRTTIVIAHRLSTIQHADKIIVLNKGEIVEIGNHHQLLRKKGAYYNFCQLQNTG